MCLSGYDVCNLMWWLYVVLVFESCKCVVLVFGWWSWFVVELLDNSCSVIVVRVDFSGG